MKMKIIQKVILTLAAAALFIVPVSIIVLQSNTTKTAEAGNHKYSSNPCNSICQSYYTASNKNNNSCPVMYYSYITKSYSSCTQVHQPANYQTNYSNATFCPVYCYYQQPQTPQPVAHPQPAPKPLPKPAPKPVYNNYTTYSTDYSYYNPNSYQSYIPEQSYNIPVPQPKQDYYDIYVEAPKQDYIDIYVPQPKNESYSTSNYNYVDYISPSYDAYTIGNTDFNNHNSYEALTTDYVYSN